MQAKFSIIVLSHLRRSFLAQAMASIEGQTCRNFDVLIVDSGQLSTEIAERYSDWNIEVVQTGEPKGLNQICCPTSWVLNRYIDQTKGDWIVSLCDDDLLLPTYIEAFNKFTPLDSHFPMCFYTGQLRVVTDAAGAIRKVKKVCYANRSLGKWSVDCKIDYLQFCYNRAMWNRLKIEHSEPFPESLETAHHNDGIFMKRAVSISRAMPVPGIHCINRRHPQAKYAGVQ